jgi:hypothetical protein
MLHYVQEYGSERDSALFMAPSIWEGDLDRKADTMF